MRKSNRIREPPRDLFAKDFVMTSKARYSTESMRASMESEKFGGKSGSRFSTLDSVDNQVSIGNSVNVEELRKENDNMLCVLDVQSEKIRKLEGDVAGEVTDCTVVTHSKMDELVEELVNTKQNNASLRLDMNVLIEKLQKQEEEIELLKGENKRINTVRNDVSSDLDGDYNREFPNLIGGAGDVGQGMSQGKTWANIVGQNRSRDAGVRLEYVQPLAVDGLKIVHVTREDVEEECRRWEKALVVYVLGGKPHFHAMRKFFENKWRKYGVANVCLLKTGVFIVEFDDCEARVKVLEDGPWYFDAKPLIVKPWTSDSSLEREGLQVVPVWVKFPNLKLHLWSQNMLSRIASLIGKPLFTDMMTAHRSILTYARVCVEISIDDELPEKVFLQEPNGIMFEQVVEYEWVPSFCKHCNVFGHLEAKCNNKKPSVKQVWRPKVTSAEPEVAQSSGVDRNVESEVLVIGGQLVRVGNSRLNCIEVDVHIDRVVDCISADVVGTAKAIVREMECSVTNTFATLEKVDQELPLKDKVALNKKKKKNRAGNSSMVRSPSGVQSQ